MIKLLQTEAGQAAYEKWRKDPVTLEVLEELRRRTLPRPPEPSRVNGEVALVLLGQHTIAAWLLEAMLHLERLDERDGSIADEETYGADEELKRIDADMQRVQMLGLQLLERKKKGVKRERGSKDA